MELMKDIFSYAFASLAFSMFFFVFVNYVVMKALLLRELSSNYKEEWVAIGKPKFFSMTENIDKILSLNDILCDSHPLKNRIFIYSVMHKIENYVVLAGLVSCIIVWCLDKFDHFFW